MNLSAAPKDMSADSKPSGSAHENPDMYPYWRFRIMYSMMMGYAGFYLARQNITIVMPIMQSELGYTKTQIGLVITIAALFYGLGKAISGAFGDQSNARYFMTFGLFFSGIMNIFMGVSSSLPLFIIFWSCNSCFQSMGWPACARLLTHWFSAKEIATKWAIWNMSQQIGGASVLIISGFLIDYYGWRYVFYVPGVVAIVMSFLLFNRLRDTPQSLNLPSIEEYHGLVEPNQAVPEEDIPFRDLIIQNVLKNKLVWYVCLANFFLYNVRMTIFNWAPTFLKEMKGSSLNLAGWQTASFDIAGMFGGVMAGYLSDKVFHGYRGRVGALFMFLLTICLILLWKTPAHNPLLHFLAMIGIGFLISGPQILVGVAAADFASKKAAGTASGLTGTFGYLGTALTGVGIGTLVDHYGWDCAFAILTISAALGILFFALTWNHRAKVLDDIKKP